MGYRIWSAFQTLFLFIAAWIYVDMGTTKLWVANWLNSLGTPWFSATTVIGWIILIIAILQLIKSIIVVVRKEY